MKLFQEGRNIKEAFEFNLKKIESKLSEYDYKQLKEFSTDEIEAISSIGWMENVVIDFDNPDFRVEHGKMRRYNDYYRFNFGVEYYDVDALTVNVNIPILQGERLVTYKGNPSTFTLSARAVDMEITHSAGKSYLTFSMSFELSEIAKMAPEQQKEKTRKEYNEYIYGGKFYYEPFRREIENFNNSLPQRTKEMIEKIVRRDSVLDMFSQAIGVEVSPKNSDREKGEKIVITPKKIQPLLPDKKTYEGYYIDNTNYRAILQTIREHLVATETLPKPVQKLSDEELIRDTILWALNANYIVATGETFRAGGKTDINVSFNDKSAFIAECKVWHGPNTFSDALNQVYGYATWRDCRIAILIFNLSNKDFGKLLSTLEQQIKENENFLLASKKSPSEWECKFKSHTDSSSNITVNVFVADYCLRK